MIFGGTGSGKTSSIMLPAFFNFAFNNCPGLILDIITDYVDSGKENESSQEDSY